MKTIPSISLFGLVPPPPLRPPPPPLPPLPLHPPPSRLRPEIESRVFLIRNENKISSLAAEFVFHSLCHTFFLFPINFESNVLETRQRGSGQIESNTLQHRKTGGA